MRMMKTQWVPYPLTLARTFDQLSQEEEESASRTEECPPDTSPTEDGEADEPPFLIGEETPDEIGLSDGKEIFINDVLGTAEWCVL
jgi:hypothetical protein